MYTHTFCMHLRKNKAMNKYGLIGENVDYSMSPIIHNYLFDYYNILGTYELISVNNLNKININDFRGLNITIPYKKKIISKVDNIDSSAKNIGAINTVLNKDKKLFGYNTDILGFDRFYRKNISKIKVVGILGNGATTSMLSYYFESRGIKYLIFTRNENFIKNIKTNKMQGIEYPKSNKDSKNFLGYHLYEDMPNFNIDFIINTTPLGQGSYINKTPIDRKILISLKELKYVLDFNYNPINTRLILDAKSIGVRTFNGLEILVFQAIYSFEIWTEIKVDEAIFFSAYQNVLKKLSKGIIVYGMPLSGKTFFYNKLKKDMKDYALLYDLDLEIEKNIKMTIKDYIEQYGIENFRKKESLILKNIINAQENNLKFKVIFLGGGTLTNKGNFNILDNYIFYYNKVGLRKLLGRIKIKEIKKRPLLKNKKHYMMLYTKRIKFYDSIYDELFTINKIKEMLRNF